MSWQTSTRNVFLFAIVLQLSSAQVVGPAADREVMRALISSSWQQRKPLSEYEWQEAFESARLVLVKLYNGPPDSLQPLTQFEIRVMRRQLADVLGLDARSIDSQTDSAEEIEKQWKSAAAWRDEIIASSVHLYSYLEQPTVNAIDGARTQSDRKFVLLRNLTTELGNNLGNFQSDEGGESERTKEFSAAVRRFAVVFGDYYELREDVDRSAYIDGYIANQGQLAYGDIPWVFAQKKDRIPEITIVGFRIKTANISHLNLLAVLNIFTILMLYRLVFLSRSTLFLKTPNSQASSDPWFVQALPKTIRSILLLILPFLLLTNLIKSIVVLNFPIFFV